MSIKLGLWINNKNYLISITKNTKLAIFFKFYFQNSLSLVRRAFVVLGPAANF